MFTAALAKIQLDPYKPKSDTAYVDKQNGALGDENKNVYQNLEEKPYKLSNSPGFSLQNKRMHLPSLKNTQFGKHIIGQDLNRFSISRVLLVSEIPANIDLTILKKICLTFGDVALVKFKKFGVNLVQAVVAWFDLRDAVKAFKSLSSNFSQISGFKETKVKFVHVLPEPNIGLGVELNCLMEESAFIYVGMSKITTRAVFEGRHTFLYNKISSICDVFFIEEIGNFQDKFLFKCAVYDIRMLEAVRLLMDGNKEKNCWFFVQFSLETLYQKLVEQDPVTSLKENANINEKVAPEKYSGQLHHETQQSRYRLVRSQLEMIQNTPNLLRHLHSLQVTVIPVARRNAVDLVKIAKGLDTRTTIMIRNIPNKITQTMLETFINVTNKHTYDFLYLRIDFSKNCNVGYAFVSFTAPEHIIRFAQARVGKKWNCFESEKICDISYANVQGQDCLIEKFRNSGVMNQFPEYRPKLYYTEGPLVGQEMEFPKPNNSICYARSLANSVVQKI